MKGIKKLSLMLVAIFTLSGVAMADEVKQERRKADPKERAEKMTERMVKEYDLNDTQKQQLLALNQTVADKMGNRPARPHQQDKKCKCNDKAKAHKDGLSKENRERRNKDMARVDRDGRKDRADAPRPSTEEREKRMQEMKQARENYNAQLQKIMNNEQYQAYAKKQAEREQKRQERGEKTKENRSQRSVSGKSSKRA